jgi:hypothetical protein
VFFFSNSGKRRIDSPGDDLTDVNNDSLLQNIHSLVVGAGYTNLQTPVF